MTEYPDHPDLELDPTYVLDDDQYADPDQEDIGEIDLEGEEIPEDLDVGDLDALVAAVEDDDGSQ